MEWHHFSGMQMKERTFKGDKCEKFRDGMIMDGINIHVQYDCILYYPVC
jgi:hypothetical protein